MLRAWLQAFFFSISSLFSDGTYYFEDQGTRAIQVDDSTIAEVRYFGKLEKI